MKKTRSSRALSVLKKIENVFEELNEPKINVYCTLISNLIPCKYRVLKKSFYVHKIGLWFDVDRKSSFSHLDSFVNSVGLPAVPRKLIGVLKSILTQLHSFWLVHFDLHLGKTSALINCFCVFLTFLL